MIGTDSHTNFDHLLNISSVGFAKTGYSLSLLLPNGEDPIVFALASLLLGLISVEMVELWCSIIFVELALTTESATSLVFFVLLCI